MNHPKGLLVFLSTLTCLYPRLGKLNFSGLVVCMASKEDLIHSAQTQPELFDTEFVERALALDDVCAAAFHDQEIVGCVWGARKLARHNQYLDVSVNYPYLYGYKSFVKKEYRGSSLSVDLIHTRDIHLLGAGFTNTIMFIETKNRASLKIMEKVGGRIEGYVGYFRWGRPLVHLPQPANGPVLPGNCR